MSLRQQHVNFQLFTAMQARKKLTEALPIGANWNRNEECLRTLSASEEEIENRMKGSLTE